VILTSDSRSEEISNAWHVCVTSRCVLDCGAAGHFQAGKKMPVSAAERQSTFARKRAKLRL